MTLPNSTKQLQQTVVGLQRQVADLVAQAAQAPSVATVSFTGGSGISKWGPSPAPRSAVKSPARPRIPNNQQRQQQQVAKASKPAAPGLTLTP